MDYLWWVRWDTPVAFTQDVIPRPAVHLVAEWWEGEPRLMVYGVPTQLFKRKLSGVGCTLAAAFRPGAFRPFISESAASIVDQVLPAQRVMGVDDRSVARELLDSTATVERRAAELVGWLQSLERQPDPRAEQVAALVERVEADVTIVRAHQLAAIAGVSSRTLGRWFDSYVGVSPKAVIQRHRLLDVAAAANAGEDVDWAALASRLGYADQSHLIRHFQAVVGESPARYVGRRG